MAPGTRSFAVSEFTHHDRPRVDLEIWLADLTYTQQQISAELIPQAIGGIATFTESHVSLPRPVRLFKYPEALAKALQDGQAPDVIGFSNYVWNSNLSLAFARKIRSLSPQTVVIFGGPNYPVVPAEQEVFLRANPVIDFYITKEGELAFARLISALGDAANDASKVKLISIPSVHTIRPNGIASLTEEIERITDLTQIPSPYTTGKLDEFFDGKLLPIIQTNRGCPFSCTFCVEGVSYYNKIYHNSSEKVAAEIHYIGKKMASVRAEGGRNDLFIADSNFGMYKDDIDVCKEIAKAQDQYGWPEYINVATGKNQKARVLEAARLVRGAIRLSGSVQSLDETVLKNVRRSNIGAKDLMQLALDAAEVDANSYSEIILGLPGDTREAHFGTMRQIIDAGFHKVIPYTLMILTGSEMGTTQEKHKYNMDLRYRILPRCFGVYDVCGERIVSAEIEEVCVATNSLSYDDYLSCRQMHLIISIFYNDGVFSALLAFLRRFNISIFSWLESLLVIQPTKDLADLFLRFEQATRDELWPNRKDLRDYVGQPGIIEKYIAGDLGLNLLFTFKSIAMNRHGDSLCQHARNALLKVMAENELDDQSYRLLADDLVRFDKSRMSEIFDDVDCDVRALFSYDIPRYLSDATKSSPSSYLNQHPIEYSFTLDDSQKEIIRRGLRLFGNDDAGIGRILSKFHITRLLRSPVITCQGAPSDQRQAGARTINIHDA